MVAIRACYMHAVHVHLLCICYEYVVHENMGMYCLSTCNNLEWPRWVFSAGIVDYTTQIGIQASLTYARTCNTFYYYWKTVSHCSFLAAILPGGPRNFLWNLLTNNMRLDCYYHCAWQFVWWWCLLQVYGSSSRSSSKCSQCHLLIYAHYILNVAV